MLFHYTNHDGLLGILDSRAIWATDVRALNDSTEFDAALDWAQGSLMQLKKSLDSSVARHMNDAIVDVAREKVFVASFSERGDHLSQWRGYGNPQDRRSYSIGFEADVLQKLSLKSGFRLEKCIYSESEMNNAVDDLIDFSLICFRNMRSRGLEDVQADKAIADSFRSKLLQLAPRYKHSAFLEESEWRFIAVSPTSAVSERSGRNGARKYITIPLVNNEIDLLPVRKIFVGPTFPSTDQAWDAAGLALTQQHIGHIALQRSHIPYRDP
jgi:Protein of unknown function (DUF2971)